MLDKLKKWGVVLLIAALVTIAGLASYRAQSLNSQLTKAVGDYQAEKLTSAEWRKTAVRLKEVDLPHLQDQLRIADEVATQPLVRTRIVTETVEVPIEVATVVEVPGECATSSELPVDLSVSVSNDLQLAIDVTETGEVFYTGKLFTTLAGPLFPEHRTVEYDLPQTAQVGVAPIVPKALAYYKNRPPRFAFVRQPRHWRFGLSLGIAVSVNPYTGEVVAGPGAVLGLQF